MPKQPISVTLDADNVTWLKGRAGAAGLRSVSELLDRIVSAARASGSAGVTRSVVGTIDIDAADPLLETADAHVRAMFERSAQRSMIARAKAPRYDTRPRAPRKRRG